MQQAVLRIYGERRTSPKALTTPFILTPCIQYITFNDVDNNHEHATPNSTPAMGLAGRKGTKLP